MKTKFLLSALALPLIFGACTNDELLSTTERPVQNGELVEVGPNFVIAGVKGDNAATKGAWVENNNQLNFLWIPAVGDGGTEAILDKIGICWVGNGGASNNVYTNYEFVHDGWLAKDEMSAEVEPCDGYITNGYNFEDNISYSSGKLGTDNIDFNSITDGKFINLSSVTTANNKAGDYNLASAFFRTSAQTLFKGDYIAYSPFDDEFVEEGPVVAKSPTTFDVDLNNEYAHLGDAMFAYGYAPGLVGGQMASAFNFKNLSGLIRVRLSGGDLTSISSVALYDESGKFITSVGLSAQKIMAESGANSTGTALYVSGTEKYTNMLTADVTSISGSNADIFFSALPTTTGALKVVLFNNSTSLSAVYDAAAITVVPGSLVDVEVSNIAATDFNKRVATSEAALKAMVDDNQAVTLLGDIELTESWNLDKEATIEGGKIIVPSAETNQIVWTISADATINSDIEIENQGCCNNYAGKLALGISTYGNNAEITLAGTIDNYGEIATLPAQSANNKNVVTVTGKINNHAEYIPEIDETRYGSITVVRKTTLELEADLQNDGVITIEAGQNAANNEDGTVNVAADRTITNNHEMTNGGNINNAGSINNTASGWFIDKIGSQVGLKQVTTGEGEYVCEVNGQTRLGDALSSNYEGIITRVRFVNNNANGGGQGSYDFYELSDDNDYSDIDFEVAMTDQGDKVTFTSSARNPNANTIYAHPIHIGNLIVTSGNLIIEYVGLDQWGRKDGLTDLYAKNITVDGATARYLELQVDTHVEGNVELNEMMNNVATIIGTSFGTPAAPVESVMNVGGKFTVGTANTTAAVSFMNSNTTNITGNFELNAGGTCTIEVATNPTADIYAARVWAANVLENGGKWGNDSKVRIRTAAAQ